MEIGLTAKVAPEIDERESDKQASKLQEKMQSAVEDLEADESLEETLERAEEMKEQLEEAKEAKEAMEGADMSASAGAGGGGASTDGPEGPSSLTGVAAERGRSRIQDRLGGKGDSAKKAGEQLGVQKKMSSKLGNMSKMLMRGAAAIAIVGFAALALGKIWDGIKALASTSPLLGQVVEMFELAMSLFFRPFASTIGQFLLPIAAVLLEFMAAFNRVFAERGLVGALAWAAKQIIVGIIEGFWAAIKWVAFELPWIILENLPQILALVVMGALAVALAPIITPILAILGAILLVAGLFGKTGEAIDLMVDIVFGLYDLLVWSFDTVISLLVDGIMWLLNNIEKVLFLIALPFILVAALTIAFFSWLWEKLKEGFSALVDLGVEAGELTWSAIVWTGEIAWSAIVWGGEILWSAIVWSGEIAWSAIVWGGEVLWSAIVWSGEVLWSAIVWGGEVLWSTIVWGGEILWSAIVWSGEVLWSAIVWGGEILWSAIVWGGKVLWSAIVWGGEILWSSIVWGGKMLWGAIEWTGDILWDAIKWTGAIELGRWMFSGAIDILELLEEGGAADAGEETGPGRGHDDPNTGNGPTDGRGGGVGGGGSTGGFVGGLPPDWIDEQAAALQEGGIVTGPTSALIGEGSESEAVLPLSKLEGMINTGGDVNRGELEEALTSSLGEDLNSIEAVMQELVRLIKSGGVTGPIKITADGKVIAEVSEDARDKYKRSREVNK